MTDALLLFLPGEGLSDWRWARVAADGAVARGEGLPETGDARVIAVPPADAVTLHWAELPDRSSAQATAAARVLVADASAEAAGALHVAVGRDGAGERPIAVVAADRMRAWLARLAIEGVDPDAIVPAPLLLPPPETGYVRADPGGGSVVRGTTSGFADEAWLTPLIAAAAPLESLARDAVDQALGEVARAPTLDLRQGVFARRRRRAIDPALLRRIATMAAGILLLTLAIDLVRIAKYAFGADALEARAETIARTGLPRGTTVTDPARQLTERLARLRGPGLGFSATAAAAFGAIRAVPDSEITSLRFEPNGDLVLGIAVAQEAGATDAKRSLEAAGFAVRASVFQAAGGRVTGELTVARP